MTLTERGLWNALHTMLHEFDLSPRARTRAVEEAAKRAPDDVVCNGFLEFCPETHFRFLFEKAVERGLKMTAARLYWTAVLNLLSDRHTQESQDVLEEVFTQCQKFHVLRLVQDGCLLTETKAVDGFQKVLSWSRDLCQLVVSCCHGRQFTPSTRVNAGNHKPY
jgi:hypothetical protein